MDDVPTIQKVFEYVICGQRTTESFTIENKSKTTQKLVIVPRTEKKSDACYERLKIQPLQAVTPPGKTTCFTLTYLSYLENVVDNFSYDIFDQDKLEARLNVHAQSVGPSLNPTYYNLKFFRFRDVSQTVKHVGLVNKTKCEAKFYLDVDEDNQMLQFSQTSGVLSVGTKLSLKITFTPIESGVYYKQIFCLVQFHNPIIINVLGIYKPKLCLEPKNLSLKYPPQIFSPSTYEAYMAKLTMSKLALEEKKTFSQKYEQELGIRLSESINADELDEKKNWSVSLNSVLKAKTKPSVNEVCNEIVLTTPFIDVKSLSEISKATTLVNLSQSQFYFFQWDHDPKNHFQIEPCKGVIEPNGRVDFSVYFTPSVADRLYHVEVDLRVFPYNDENGNNSSQNIDLPVTISLRIVGHSFPDNSCGWIPQCTVVPKALQLPSCVPGEVVYGTFVIERRGHLPVSFTTIPSKEENYLVQPPLGYFSGNFHLFVVQFNGNSKEEGIYKKDLKIVYNNLNSSYDIIKLTTSVEIPNIVFGNNNSYTFESTFPGSKILARIPMENSTNLYLSYEFQIPDYIKWIEIPYIKGFIEPKCRCHIDAIFKPETPCEYLDYITCIVSSTSRKEYSKTIQVQFIGSCQFGNLVATPSIHDFGECIYETEKSITVHLFNFSPVHLYFKLYTISQDFSTGNIEKDVKIKPCQGDLPGRKHLEMEVTIIPHNIDIFQYAIMCQIMENDARDSFACDEPRTIFSFKFEGVLPAFQIIDLNIDGGGPLFSPDWIWKMMSINRLNNALNSLVSEQIDVRLPEAVIMACPITIALLLEANRFGEITFSIHKNIICCCFPSAEDYVIQTNNCPHTNTMSIKPMEAVLGPKKRLILQIVLNYESLEKCMIEWTFNLPYNRKVTLSTSIVTLPNVNLSLTSMYMQPTVHLKPVFIGDSEPSLQLFWLYNNTQQVASYVMDKLTLREAAGFGHRILDCVNPSGNIPPFSCIPLAFLFKPNEITSYSVETYLCMQNNKFSSIYLKGEGVPYNLQFTEFAFENTIPKKPILYNANIALECSVNIINIKFLPTFSQAKRIFFLRNKSSSEEWAFQWHNFTANKLINAHVEPVKGIIKPRQKMALTVVLRSFCSPTSISFSIPCDVINYSELESYKKALRYRDIIVEKTKDYFTITEKGTFHECPGVTIPEKPKSYHLFLTVNTNVISHTNANQKLTLNQQLILKTGNELAYNHNYVHSVTATMILPIQQSLEKILWKVLNSKVFKHKIKILQESNDHNYMQLLSDPKPEIEDINYRGSFIPSKNYVQSFLEDVLKTVICKNFTSSDYERN